jgi:hypothetical protein
VGGQRFDGEADAGKPPPAPGSVVTGRYLPGDPGHVRLLPVDLAAAHAASEPFRGLRWILGLTAAILVGIAFAPFRPGLVVGFAFAAILLRVNAYDDVQIVFARAFGPSLGGVPMPIVVTVAELVLVVPALVVFGDGVFSLAQGLWATGASAPTGAFGLTAVLIRRLPEPLAGPQRRARIAGAWLALIGVGWMLFAAIRGI